MSLQTLAFNCLACHILAKHLHPVESAQLTSTKRKYKTIQVNQSITLVNNELKVTTKLASKNQLRKIA